MNFQRRRNKISCFPPTNIRSSFATPLIIWQSVWCPNQWQSGWCSQGSNSFILSFSVFCHILSLSVFRQSDLNHLNAIVGERGIFQMANLKGLPQTCASEEWFSISVEHRWCPMKWTASTQCLCKDVKRDWLILSGRGSFIPTEKDSCRLPISANFTSD